jgi:hypothetical protein
MPPRASGRGRSPTTTGARDGDDAGQDHLLQRRVVAMSTHLALSGSAGALQQAGDLAELTADLLDHLEGRVTDRGHGDGGDQEGQMPPMNMPMSTGDR